MAINRNSSLADFQARNRKIYFVANSREYDSIDLFCHLLRHTTHMLKGSRTGDYSHMEYRLCMAFSWALALANRFDINLSDEMWKRFPGCCPYCISVPCGCKKRPEKRQDISGKIKGQRPVSLASWQKMLARIYPNKLKKSASHAVEEVGEAMEAFGNHDHLKRGCSNRNEIDWFEKTVEELVDVFTHIFAVATCLGINLAAGLVKYFVRGCPKCRNPQCICGYIAVDMPVRPWTEE